MLTSLSQASLPQTKVAVGAVLQSQASSNRFGGEGRRLAGLRPAVSGSAENRFTAFMPPSRAATTGITQKAGPAAGGTAHAVASPCLFQAQLAGQA